MSPVPVEKAVFYFAPREAAALAVNPFSGGAAVDSAQTPQFAPPRAVLQTNPIVLSPIVLGDRIAGSDSPAERPIRLTSPEAIRVSEVRLDAGWVPIVNLRPMEAITAVPSIDSSSFATFFEQRRLLFDWSNIRDSLPEMSSYEITLHGDDVHATKNSKLDQAARKEQEANDRTEWNSVCFCIVTAKVIRPSNRRTVRCRIGRGRSALRRTRPAR